VRCAIDADFDECSFVHAAIIRERFCRGKRLLPG
jgi:hypothetical protein